MPIIMPKGGGGGAVKYTVGANYSVGEQVFIRGVTYEVQTAIVNAPLYADYDKLAPISLGMGHATWREYNTNLGTDNWLRICDIPVYFSGTVSLGGIFPAKQISINMRINTSYQLATIAGEWVTFVSGAIREIKLIQYADGQPWQLWVNVAQESLLWKMHMVAIGSGENQITVTNNAVSTTTHPGAGTQQYYFNYLGANSGTFDSQFVPGSAIATYTWRSSSTFYLGAKVILNTASGWQRTTSDSNILGIENTNIRVKRDGHVLVSFTGKTTDGRRMQIRHNGGGLQETDGIATNTILSISELRAVVANQYFELWNPGTGGATWSRASFTAIWTP